MINKIICLSTTNFHPLPTRKQNVMIRLENSEILYFDPPVSIIAQFKDKTLKNRLTMYKKGGQKVKDNVTVYALPPVLPFFNKFRLINKINQAILARFVRKIMKQHDFTYESILWCYSPSSCDIIKHLPHSRLVYDCVDRHSAYKGIINPVVIDKMEEELTKSCDMVFSTAIGLHNTLIKYNSRANMIPNGAAYEIFSRVQTQSFSKPPELANLPFKKIFGFVGMLQECIDYQLIEKLCKAFPDTAIVLIGKTLPGVNLDHLKQYKNIIFKGLVAQDKLPSYISQFDICLNLFKPGRLSKDVSPLKFYEYLATGKPIVSTQEPLQVADFSDIVYIAKNHEEFINLCAVAYDENDPDKIKKRMACAKECSWDMRVAKMQEILYNLNIMNKE